MKLKLAEMSHAHVEVAKNIKSAVEDKLLIRIATAKDAPRLAEIYNEYVLTGSVSYEYDAVSDEDFAKRIIKYTERYPYLVAVENDKIIGYAYASQFRPRFAFNWDSEVSVYLDKDCRGKGVGSILLGKVLDILKACNYITVYSYINFPNEESIALHEKFGFVQCAFYKNTGYKLGKWRSLMGMEKRISNCEIPKEIDINWQKYL